MTGYTRGELKVIRQGKVSEIGRDAIATVLQRDIPEDVFKALTTKVIDRLLEEHPGETIFIPYKTRK